jgi:hypothetical protein
MSPEPTPKPAGGPKTPEGRAASSQNAITFGLFATRDFIRPDEQSVYTEFAQSLHADLAPEGMLELNLADEIRGAMWRLRRCRQIEESFSHLAEDPMQQEASARLQFSVDRARSLSHRLLHKSTAELRKLQTERLYRNEYFKKGTDLAFLGISDLPAMQRNIVIQHAREQKQAGDAAMKAFLAHPYAPELSADPDPDPEPASSFCTGAQTPRNAPCPCGSGQKHKRCCGKNAPAVLKAA